jgi:hypothetical protein
MRVEVVDHAVRTSSARHRSHRRYSDSVSIEIIGTISHWVDAGLGMLQHQHPTGQAKAILGDPAPP